jgi:hypothetical protein
MNSGGNELLPVSPPPDLVSYHACPIQNIRHIFMNAKPKSTFIFGRIIGLSLPEDFIGFLMIFLKGAPIIPVKIPLKSMLIWSVPG